MLLELIFVAVYTGLWFGGGFLIGQNVFYAKMEAKDNQSVSNGDADHESETEWWESLSPNERRECIEAAALIGGHPTAKVVE